MFDQPTSLDDRQDVARQCTMSMAITMPCVVDTMDNQVDQAYAAWPERIYIVGTDGKIAYAGHRGPWGFEPDQVRRWLRRHVGG